MVANILIAGAFFALGFIVGGILTLRSCWKQFESDAKKIRETQSDPLIIRVYGVEE